MPTWAINFPLVGVPIFDDDTYYAKDAEGTTRGTARVFGFPTQHTSAPLRFGIGLLLPLLLLPTA